MFPEPPSIKAGALEPPDINRDALFENLPAPAARRSAPASRQGDGSGSRSTVPFRKIRAVRASPGTTGI